MSPASGLAIGGLVIGGRRFWPAVLVGAFAANLPEAMPWWAAATIAMGNTVEALVGAWLIAWFRQVRSSPTLLVEATGCAVAALAGPLFSAGIGVAALVAANLMPEGLAFAAVRTWWLGHALGALTIAPAVLALARGARNTRATGTSIALAAGVAALVAGVVFFLPAGGMLLFAVFPALLLSTRWGGEAGVKLGAVGVAAVGIVASILGHGPFVGGTLNDNLLFLQLFLGSVAIAGLVLPVFSASGSLMMAGVFLVVGWSVSGWVFARLHRERLSTDRARLESLAADAERATRQRMATYLEALRAGTGLFAASAEVTRDEWEQFVGRLDLQSRLPGLHHLGVVWRVQGEGEDVFVETRRRDGAPDFSIRTVPGGTSSAGPERFVVSFVSPPGLDRSGEGLDIATEARRRRAAEEARDAGEPRATGRLAEVDEHSGHAGFWVFHPIFRRGFSPASVPERREALVGWIYASLFAEDLFGTMFVSPEVEISVFDGRSIASDALLYTSRIGPVGRAGYDAVATIELAGSLFTFAWNRSEHFEIASPAASVVTASSLALVTLLLAGLGVSLQSIGRQARDLAAARTVELSAAQLTLAGVNQLQRAVLDGTTYSIIATEIDGTIRIFNRGAEVMLGYRREEVIGRQTPAIIHLADEVAARASELTAELGRRIEPGFEVLVARAALGEVEQREWTYVRRNGSHVPVQLTVTALRDEAGVISGYLGIAHDLTERRALEQSLQLEQSRLRLANEAAGIAVWEWDVDSGALTWDAAMFVLYGMAPTVGGRVAYDDWRHCVHPDDLLAQEVTLQSLLRDAGRGQREFRIIRHSDDEIRYVSASELAIAGTDGRTVRVVGVNRDITDQRRAVEQLRQSQARLASIFGAVREGLLLTDGQGTILECNAAACRILGVAREQMRGRLTAGRDWQTVRQDGTPYPASEHPSAVTLRTGEPVRDAVMGLGRPDGAVAWISVDTAPIHDPSGAVQAVVVSLSDVSARQQIAHDLARARDEALETLRLKSEFLATMSHEIRTPMNGIIGTADLLLGTPLDPTQHEMTRLIQGSAENLLEIINDILDFSRIEAGKFRINPEPFELLPLLEETVALLAVRAERRGLELVLDVAPALSTEVLVGDPGRIRQVLINIIGNAVKFTERGEIVVAAAVVPSAAGMGRLRVTVRDTGIGIAPESRDRLFHAFTQVDSSATRRFGGTGLGLAISRQLVELMGGQLDFSSEPGHGSEFWIELELARQPGQPVGLDDGDLDVLVVDDNATARDTLVRQLGRLGARAAAVASAAAALTHLAQGAPTEGRRRVVLADRAMPGVDGITLARRIREVAALGDIAIVLLTPPGASPLPQELQGLGCSAIVGKPVRLAQLRVALSQARRGTALAVEVAHPGGPAAREARQARKSGLNVLVAEDNPTNQLVARMVLESLGHRVDVADNGRIALDRLAEARYDVVFMDCQMPELDGYEATRRVRSGTLPGVDPHQPVIALTAFAMESDQAKCRAAGMDDYVSKPMRAAEVGAVLARCGLGESALPPPVTEPEAAPSPLAAIQLEPVVDEAFQDGLRELPGMQGPSLLAEVIELYTREAAARLAELPTLLAAGEHDALARVAHTLAGSSANAGAPRARAAFAAIETAVRMGALAEAPERIATARQVWQELCAELIRRGLHSP